MFPFFSVFSSTWIVTSFHYMWFYCMCFFFILVTFALLREMQNEESPRLSSLSAMVIPKGIADCSFGHEYKTISTSFFSTSLPCQVDTNCHLSSPISIKTYKHTRVLRQKSQVFLHVECINEFLQKNIVIVLQTKCKSKFSIFPHQMNNHSACLPDFHLPQNNRFMGGMFMCSVFSTAANEPHKPFFSPHTEAQEHSVMYTEYMHTPFGEVDALRWLLNYYE